MKPQQFGFRSYTFLPIVALLPEDTPTARGGFSYLINNVGLMGSLWDLWDALWDNLRDLCPSDFFPFIIYLLKETDYYLASASGNPSRFAKVDFPAACAYWPISTLLPYPKETIDLAACFKPLKFEVNKG